jgi:primosomal protein N'
MILPNIKRLFVNRITGNPISLSTYTSMMHTEMQKSESHLFFTAYSLKHAAIEKLVRLGMELPKINKSARLAMNSSVALSYYSPLAANNNTICMLITKDQDKQKEEVNNLLSLEKEKFEEESPSNEEEKEYQDEYNKLFGDDQEIENIVLQKDKNIKKIRIKKISQKGDLSEKDNTSKQISSIDPMRQSQKMSLINAFNSISSDQKGNTETTPLLSPSFPK